MYFLLPVRRVWISRYIERFKGGTGPTRYWFYAYRVFRSNTSLSKRKDRDFVKSDRANLHLSRSDRHYRHNSIKSLPIYRFTSKILIIPSSRLIILLHLKKISLFQFLIFNSDRRISICVIGNNNNFKWKVKILIVTRWLVIINKFKCDRQYIFGGREPPVNLRNHQCVIVRRSGRKCSRFSSLIL